MTSRRAFLRDAALAASATLAMVSIAKPAMAFVQSVSGIEPTSMADTPLRERAYAIPMSDGVSVDAGNEVILARWENRVYAFSLKCPHKGARLEWRGAEERVFCPKHKARFLGDGTHVSGRGSRDLDRFAIRRTADGIVVSLDRIYRRDTQLNEWTRAAVSL
jgi:nitrite reductase/ring-hydroxylating ferredoxin subunit